MGPKASIEITFMDIKADEYYVTLLSKSKSTGQYSYFDEDYERFDEYYSKLNDIEKKFYHYKDSDNYYFVGNVQKLSQNQNVYKWGYMPPNEFKILVYIEESDTFIASCEHISRYAFNSYFTVYYKDGIITDITKTYEYGKEILNCIIRIMATLIIELGIALIFKYRKMSLLFILITNVATQILLNVFTNIDYYKNGGLSSTVLLIALEIIILFIESIIYAIFLPKIDSNNRRLKAILYALLANASSFAAGLLIFKMMM